MTTDTTTIKITAKTTLAQAIAIAMIRSSVCTSGSAAVFPHRGVSHPQGGGGGAAAIRKALKETCESYSRSSGRWAFSARDWQVRLDPDDTWRLGEERALLSAAYDASLDDAVAHKRLVARLASAPTG